MSPRILLADDSPHAQRMGERILREEGFEVVTVTDGNTVLHRLDDVKPDVILLDAFLPDHSGFELCRQIKANPRHSHAGVILVAGLLEPVNDGEASAAGADAVLKKPFEATAVVEAVRPLVEKARNGRNGDADAKDAPAGTPAAAQPVGEPAKETGDVAAESAPEPAQSASAAVPAPESESEPDAPFVSAVPEPARIDPEIVRAAVTIALERAFPSLVDEITRKVLDSMPPSGASNGS